MSTRATTIGRCQDYTPTLLLRYLYTKAALTEQARPNKSKMCRIDYLMGHYPTLDWADYRNKGTDENRPCAFQRL